MSDASPCAPSAKRCVSQSRVKPSTVESQRSLGNTLARLAPATLLVQLVAFGSSVVLATQLGASTMTDAYYIALSVPFFTYAVLLAAVRQGAVPLLADVAARKPGRDFSTSCSELVSATIAVAALLSLCVTGVMVFVLPTAAGGDTQMTALTREYMMELAPYAVTGAALGALGAVLAIRGQFVIPALMLGCEPLLKSVLVGLCPQLGAQALVIGSVGGNLLAVIVLWQLVRRNGVTLRFVGFRSSPLVRSVVRLTIPLAVGMTVLQLNPMVDRATAAGLGTGNVTAFDLGVRLFNAPAAIVGATLVAPLAATWSARLATDGWEAVGRSFARIVAAVVILLPPVAIAGFAVRHDLVALLYKSQAYNEVAVSRTANVFGLLLLGMVAEVLIVPLATLFLVRGDTVFPMKLALTNALLNVLLDLALRRPFGVAGIAASTTVTYAVVCLLYFWEAHRRWGSLNLRSVIRPLMVSGTSGLAILASCALLFGLNDSGGSRHNQLVVAAVVLGLAALIHGTLMMVGRVSRFREL